MKKIYLWVLLNSLLVHLQGQNFSWAKIEGLWAYDYGYGISTDNAGNVYVAGKFEDTANFSGTTLPCQGNHDIWVAKYTSSGSLDWIHTGGGPSGDYARTLACNKTNNVVIAGEIEGTDPIVFPGSPITLVPKGNNDVFIASYDLGGNLLWAKSEGYSTNEKALGITYDNAGNVVICGYFTDTTIFGNSMIVGAGAEDMFVAKYTANGNLLWMKHAGGPGHEEAKSVVCDASGCIYVCGMYSNGATFGGTTFLADSTYLGYFYNAYVAKYAPDGTLLWVKSGGGEWDDLAWGMTIDNAGKLYVTGEFSEGSFDWLSLHTQGKADVFVVCYDANGNVLWGTEGGGALVERARGIGCDGSHIFLTGQFGSQSSFGSNSLTPVDSSDIFMAELDNNGVWLWATAVGGVPDTYDPHTYESGISICADPSGTAYVTGAVLNGGVFGSTSLQGYTRSDVFIAKMSTVNGIRNASASTPRVYPNPGNGIFTVTTGEMFGDRTEITIYNYIGEVIHHSIPAASKTTIDLSSQAEGVYFMQVSDGKKAFTERIVHQ